MTIEVSCRCIKADERNQSIFTKDSELDVVYLFSKRFIEITCWGVFSHHPTLQVSDAFDASLPIDLAIKVASRVIDQFYFGIVIVPHRCCSNVYSLMQSNLERPCNLG